MGQRLFYVFLIIFVLAIFNYAGNELSRAVASYRMPSLPSSPGAAAIFAVSGNKTASRGLASVDFDLFAKGGSGWDHITQGYGATPYSSWYVGHWHNGIDIAARYGAPVYSPTDGVVLATGDQDNFCPGRGFGKFVAVKNNVNNIVLWFAHLGRIEVSVGQTLSKGTEVGTIGTSGFETGAHLHFSVFNGDGFSMKNKNGCGPDADGADVNPVPYIEKFSQ